MLPALAFLFLTTILFPSRAVAQESNEIEYQSPYMSMLNKSEDHMRGIQLGDSYNEVLDVMNDETLDDIDEEEQSFIFYQIHGDPAVYLDFYFDDNGLVEGIDASAYMNTEREARRLFESFYNHALARFGTPHIQESGYLEWNLNEITVSVALVNTEAFYYYDTFSSYD